MATIDMKNSISLDTSASVDLTFSTAVVISIVCEDVCGSCHIFYCPEKTMLVQSTLTLKNHPVALEMGWFYHSFLSYLRMG